MRLRKVRDYFKSKQYERICKKMLCEGKKISTPEIILASKLYEIGIEFEQQCNIGRYTVDFLIGEKLIVEIEGFYNENPEQKARDLRKYNDLKNLGYEVLRVPTSEFYDLESLVNLIRNYLKKLKS